MKRNESRIFVQRLHGRLDCTTDGVVAWMHKQPGGRIHTLYAPPRQVPAPAARWSSGHTWVSVSTFLSRRRRDNVVCVPCLWVDIDPPNVTSGGLAEWQRAAYQKLLAFVPGPSLVVCSGRGFHAYWLFAEPVRVRDVDDRAHQVVQANRILARRLDGDAVGDLARVMRVPGTINPKTNTRCRLLVEDGPIYDFDVLVSARRGENTPCQAGRLSGRRGVSPSRGTTSRKRL